jgi:hypothetical protein
MFLYLTSFLKLIDFVFQIFCHYLHLFAADPVTI